MNQYQDNMDLLPDIEQEIFTISQGILEGTIEIFKGSRLLSSYRLKTDRLQDELLFFTGVASQTEKFPLSEAERQLWSRDALARLDKEREEFLSDTEELIREKCRSILSKLVAKSN